MDHSNHLMMDSGSMGGSDHSMHQMAFHTGLEGTFIFNSLVLNSKSKMFYASFVIFIISCATPVMYSQFISIENAIKKYSYTVANKGLNESSKVTDCIKMPSNDPKWKLILALFIFVNRTIYFSIVYILMLITMTFNITLFFSVVTGLALGTAIKTFRFKYMGFCYTLPLPRGSDSVVHDEDPDTKVCCC